MTNGQTRTEHDSMGEIEVPADALWRAQTQRAVENFPISGTPLEADHVHALALVKAAAAKVNARLGVLDQDVADAIVAINPMMSKTNPIRNGTVNIVSAVDFSDGCAAADRRRSSRMAARCETCSAPSACRTAAAANASAPITAMTIPLVMTQAQINEA